MYRFSRLLPMNHCLSPAAHLPADVAAPGRQVWINARGIGGKAPNATVSDAAGRPIKLGDLWAQGPLVLIFHPGESRSYAARQLRRWKDYEDTLVQLGATVAVACLQDPDSTLKAITPTGSRFVVLQDTNLYATSGFGIAAPLLPELARLYESFGVSCVDCGNGRWILPTPATYLIDQDGSIVFANLATDQEHVHPEELVAIIQGLRSAW